MKKIVLIHAIPGEDEVKMIQTGIDRFTVQYGLQIEEQLNYTAAALEFGACCMHASACAGVLDNRTRSDT